MHTGVGDGATLLVIDSDERLLLALAVDEAGDDFAVEGDGHVFAGADFVGGLEDLPIGGGRGDCGDQQREQEGRGTKQTVGKRNGT